MSDNPKYLALKEREVVALEKIAFFVELLYQETSQIRSKAGDIAGAQTRAHPHNAGSIE